MKRSWLLWALTAAVAWVLATHLVEIRHVAKTLAQGQWELVVAAALLQAAYYVTYTGLYQAAFHAVEVESRLVDLLPVMFGSIFVNVAAPAGGAAGTALFVDDAARRGQSPARAAAGTLLVLIADLSAFTLILVVGLAYLFRQHDLQVYEIVGAGLLLAIIGGLTAVLLFGLRAPGGLRRLLEWVERTANRLGAWLRHPNLLSAQWGEENAAGFSAAAAALAGHPQRVGRALATALAAHLLDLGSLYVLFRAFQQPVGLGTLVAGFSMGVLFWIVAITPQGIGVVEGVMALVFASLGVPALKATAVTLAFRGLGFWLPLLIGFFLLRRLRSLGAEERPPAVAWGVRAAALLTALMGAINVLSAVTTTLQDRLALLRRLLPWEIHHGAHLAAALLGFGLLLLAGNLWRHKRAAWMLTMLLLGASAISHLVKGLDYEEAILAAALAGWLWSMRSHFQAHSDPPSVRQGLRALAAALLFTLAYGTVGFYLLDRHFGVTYSLGAALEQTVIMFTQFYNPGLEPVTGFGRYFAGSIYSVGAATLCYALLMLLRPVLMRRPATAAERAQARAIVEAYGRTSIANATLFSDKSYYLSPGGSAVAYVLKGRVALTLGDPIGPAEDAAAAITGFAAHCRRNDWLPAFYQTLPDYLAHYRAAGLNAFAIGSEGIVDVAGVSTSGRANKHLRAAVNKMRRLGYRTEYHEAPLADSLLEELREVSDEWLAMMGGKELQFSLGWFDEESVRHSPALVVRALEGSIGAFANIIPEHRPDEATIDLMRHRRQAPVGMMDFLFLALFQWAGEQGYTTFNLGLSGLAGIGEQPNAPPIERALHFIYEHGDPFYHFKGLHEFKDKFHPAWSPRYLVYPGLASLPAVASALVRAHTGDRFVLDYAQGWLESLRQPRVRPQPEEPMAQDEG